jgi:hypothetical protein
MISQQYLSKWSLLRLFEQKKGLEATVNGRSQTRKIMEDHKQERSDAWKRCILQKLGIIVVINDAQ